MKRLISIMILALVIGILPASAQIDVNGNGMSDIWERHFNGGQLFPSAFLPGNDEDGDGQTNFMESVAGTDPLRFDPPHGHFVQGVRHVPATWLSSPGQAPVLLTPEAFEIDWHAIAGKEYVLLFSPDLAPLSWIPVGSPMTGSNETITIGNLPSHTDGTLPDRLFWKIQVSDLDSDGDSLSDYEEHQLGLNPNVATSFFGISDLWLATHYIDLLLSGQIGTFDPNGDTDGDGITNIEEQLGGTNPNTPESLDSQRWLALQGTGDEDQRVTKSRQFTIPAGQTALVIVAITSDEFPSYTDPESVPDYNDILEWKIEPSSGGDIEGQIDVNARDADWDIAAALGETLPGLPGTVHYEVVELLSAPPSAPLTVDVEIAATNIGDNALPSNIAVGILPVDIKLNDTDTLDDDLVPVSLGTDEDLATDFSVKITGMDGLTAVLSLKNADGNIKFKDQELNLQNGAASETKLWGTAPSSDKNQTIIEVEIWRDTKELATIEKESTVFKGVKIEFEGNFYINVDTREFSRRPWDGRTDPKPNSKADLSGVTNYMEADIGVNPTATELANYKKAVDQCFGFGYQSAISFKDGDNPGIPLYKPWKDPLEVKVTKVMSKNPSFEIPDDAMLDSLVELKDGVLDGLPDGNEQLLNPKVKIDEYVELNNTTNITRISFQPAAANRSVTSAQVAAQIAAAAGTGYDELLAYLSEPDRTDNLAVFSDQRYEWKNDSFEVQKGAKIRESFGSKAMRGAKEVGDKAEAKWIFTGWNEFKFQGDLEGATIETK